MNKFGSQVTAVLLAAVLSGCGTFKDPEETDVIETSPVETETVLTETISQLSVEEAKTAEPVSLGQLNTFFFLYRLNFYGEKISENSYFGTLMLDKYSKDENGARKELVSSCKVYDNEEFVFLPPESGALSEHSSYIVLENDILSDNGETERQFRIFLSEEDDFFEFSHENYEKLPDLLGDKGRALILEAPVYNSYGEMSDFGSDRYIEFDYNFRRRSIAVSGFIDFIPMDKALLADAREADYRNGLVYARASYYDFADRFELLGSDDYREETYYRIPADIAVNADELYDYYSEYSTDNYLGMDRDEFIENFFGGEYPYFTEDKNGLVMAVSYRGVPSTFDFNTARLAEITDNTAKLFVRGWSLDGELIAEQNFIRSDGNWKVNSGNSCETDRYFELNKMVYADGWSWLRCDFDSFDIKVGETRNAEISIASNAEMMCDENGLPYVVCIEKSEEFDGFDLSSLNINSGKVYQSEFSSESGEYLNNPDIPSYGFTFQDTGEYVIWSGWRYVTENGDIIDVTAGPKRFSVK